MAKAKTSNRNDEVAIGMGGGPYPLVPLPGARNIRTLSAHFIADLQEHWEKNGMSALDEVRQKFPDPDHACWEEIGRRHGHRGLAAGPWPWKV